MLLPPMVRNALVAGGRRSGAGQQVETCSAYYKCNKPFSGIYLVFLLYANVYITVQIYVYITVQIYHNWVGINTCTSLRNTSQLQFLFWHNEQQEEGLRNSVLEINKQKTRQF